MRGTARICSGAIAALLCIGAARAIAESAEGLIGHWKLQGDARDHSGNDHHAVNHGVDLAKGKFDGTSAYLEVPAAKSLQLGDGDFSFCAWVNTPEQLGDVVGDVFDLYDPVTRRGVTLTISSSAGGYQSQGTNRQVHFGIDNAKTTEWQDCGRPNPTSNYVNNSLTVFKGKLYAATIDAADPSGWAHVYRYDGGQKWTDCGRVGDGKTTGVGPLLVHDGNLYAATTTYDWTRVNEGDYQPGRVYRYADGTNWENLGQPSVDRTLNSMASFQGKLYVGGGPQTKGVYVQDGDRWLPSKLFPPEGPQRLWPHAMHRFNGKLFVGFPGVYSFDGADWTFVGHPVPDEKNMLQTHSMQLYQGSLHAGTWPHAKVAKYDGGETWEDIGRVGEDGTEVNALVVYNGKLYGGSIPRAEVCRYDDAPSWTSLKRFYSPENWDPGVPGQASREQVNDWSRVTSLTVHDGKLFASTGSCTSAVQDAPLDVRGKVFSMEAGKVASYGDDLGPGWKHLAAVRDGGKLKLYINGELSAESSEFDPAEYDLSADRPLRIGFGQTDYFDGHMQDVRLYGKSLSESQIQELCARQPH
jgi:hypothetical protein